MWSNVNTYGKVNVIVYVNNNNNPSGVTQCPLVRHQHNAVRRKAKNHYYTLQRPFKATGDADLRTSQAHLGTPTVSERKKKKTLEKVGDSLFLGVSLSATPSLDVGMAAGSTGNVTGFCAGRSCIVEDFAVRLLSDPVGEHLECLVPCWHR